MQDIEGLGFWATCVFQPNFTFYFGILRWPTPLPIFKCSNSNGVFTFPYLFAIWKIWRVWLSSGWLTFFILTKFESLEMTYPLYIWYSHCTHKDTNTKQFDPKKPIIMASNLSIITSFFVDFLLIFFNFLLFFYYL